MATSIASGKPASTWPAASRRTEQLWLFWLAPLVGGVPAGGVYRAVLERDETEPAVEGRPVRP